MCALERTLALVLLLSITTLVPDSSCSIKGQDDPSQFAYDDSLPHEVDDTEKMENSTTVLVHMGAKALLRCPPIPSTKGRSITWEVTNGGRSTCIMPYTIKQCQLQQLQQLQHPQQLQKTQSETICTDKRITWATTPGQCGNLQINTVALEHDGSYSCEIETPERNFRKEYDLQVLVPPKVAIFPGGNGTAVCEAIAGKPAAQIFWTPDGDCATKKESHSNGTVTVRSTCQWEQNHVSAVVCFVSHLTGNHSLSTELNRSTTSSLQSLLTILYVKLGFFVITLLTVGFVSFQKRNEFRK